MSIIGRLFGKGQKPDPDSAEDIRAQVNWLLDFTLKRRKEQRPAGAAPEDIDEFESATGLTVPAELREWLLMCNGPAVGPGDAVYGIGVARGKWFNIDANLGRHADEWIPKGWIPLCDDGCGNFYVLDTHGAVEGKYPVYFIDHEKSYEEPCYIVASGVWSFVRFVLMEEMGRSFWPFKRDRVLKADPAIANFEGKVRFPWDR